MKYKVQPIIQPVDLRKATNGQLPPSVLTPIEGGHLHHLAANAWNAMVVAGARRGIVLKPTSRWDTYRPYERQESLFYARYQIKKRITRVTRLWQNKKWYLKKGVAPAAVPGTSNHGWGLAVDVANATGPTLRWLDANAHKFGFSWEVISGPNAEAWHIRYHAGNGIPPKVQEYLDSNKPSAL